MIGNELSVMTNSEILAVSKILLESRAFTRYELKVILDKLREIGSDIHEHNLVSLRYARANAPRESI